MSEQKYQLILYGRGISRYHATVENCLHKDGYKFTRDYSTLSNKLSYNIVYQNQTTDFIRIDVVRIYTKLKRLVPAIESRLFGLLMPEGVLI